MTLPPTPSAEAELEEILDAIGVVKLADGNWTIDKRGAEHKLLAWSERQAAQRVKEAQAVALDGADDALYDLNEVDWGVPTKWSKTKDHADLWVPLQAVHEMLQSKIAALQSSEAEQQESKE